jgi:hypothetical protein
LLKPIPGAAYCDAVSEFTSNLADQDDRPTGKVNSSPDAEASSALESVSEDQAREDLPVLRKEDLPPDWRGDSLVLCVAGRSLIDEAAAIMLGQLTTAHGLIARVEGPETLSTTNVFRLDTTGVKLVCLIYLNANAAAHMRYSVRRLRRKLPKATIILACWVKDIDAQTLEGLRESAKADLAAANLSEAIQLCVEAASQATAPGDSSKAKTPSATTAA